MRGPQQAQGALFSYLSAEEVIREDHPLRAIRAEVDAVLESLSGGFEAMYARTGRPSVPPERLLRALLLQMLYTVRSERSLVDQIGYNLLFRWFVGLGLDEPVWDAATFSKNRRRLLEADVAQSFLAAVAARARRAGWASEEHFSVDGTLLEAWASLKSFTRRDAPQAPPDDPGNPSVDFHGEKRRNDTHASTTDPDAMLARKGAGKEAKLSYQANLLVENRNGLIVDTEVLRANGTAERDAGLLMLARVPGSRRITVGADKGYDTQGFIKECRNMKVTPHVAQNTRRPGGSALDARTTRHPGYAVSQRKRKRIEECFGWIKTVAGLARIRHRGLEKAAWVFTFAAAAYNLVRITNLAKLAATSLQTA